MGGNMAEKTGEGLTEDDAAAVEKLKHEAEQSKHEEALAAVSAIEGEPTPKDTEERTLSEVEAEEKDADATDSSHESGTDDKSVPTSVSKAKNPWWKRRKIVIPLGIGCVLLLVALLQLVQPIRFATFGWVQRPVIVTVYDTASKAPLDSVIVAIDGKNYTTDTKGEIRPSLAVGHHEAHLEKENYKTATLPLTVDVFSTVKARSDMTPTGKPIVIAITDRVTGNPIVGASIDSAQKTLAKTDTKGTARVVIPLDKKSLAVKVRADKYRLNETTITLETKGVQLVPEGTLHFLSKASGKIDVVKTNLDGSERKIILAGTGAEEDRATTLLASRDWQKLMLLSRREASKPAGLSIIDAASGATKPIDQSGARISLIGWSGHSFIYLAAMRQEPGKGYKPGAVTLKSYNADTDKVTVLDQNASDADGAMWEDFTTGYITDKGIVYGKIWNTAYNTNRTTLNGKQTTIMQVRADGSDKKVMAGFDAVTTTWLAAKLYEPQGIYFKISTSKDAVYSESFAEVEDGSYKQIKDKPASFDEVVYPIFLVSPNGNTVFWSESRDGKNVLFTGDRLGENKQEIAKASELTPYGWLGDDKVLVQKGGSELYVTTIDALKQGVAPLKIGDYHKANTIAGYGYGYGAQ